MLSNKLTFSLASLVVLLMIGLCLPIDAQRIQATTVITLPSTGSEATEGTVNDVIDAGMFVVFGVGLDANKDLGLDLVGSPKIVSHTNTKGGYVQAHEVLTATVAARTSVHSSPTGSQITVPSNAGIDVDLEEFFRLGGTLELIAPADFDDEDFSTDPISRLHNDDSTKAYDLVFSEIMWALDVDNDETQTPKDRKQWIEIYNNSPTTKPIVDMASIDDGNGRLKLRFVPYWHIERPGDIIPASAEITANGGAVNATNPAVKHIILDSVSNLQFVRWEVHGQNGNSTPPTANPHDPPLKPLVSMYRKIDYTQGRASGVPDGVLPGSWEATPVLARRNTVDQIHVGTPGARHVATVVHMGVTKTLIPPASASPTVVINEVRNDTSAENVDWVELYNAGPDPVDLRGWELTLTYITSDQETMPNGQADVMLVGREAAGSTDADRFPEGADWKLEPEEYLLIVNRHPNRTPLANGVNVDEVIAGKEVKAGAIHQYIVREKLNLPNDIANSLLILRNHVEKNAQHNKDHPDPSKRDVAERLTTKTDPSANIMDYAGNFSHEVKTNEYNTLVWPFSGWTKNDGSDGKDGEAIPHNRTQSHARTRYQANDGHHKDAWRQDGNMGGIGYDRGVDMKYAPGTPGYANDSVRNADRDDKATRATTDDVVFNGEVSISEVMYDAGPRWNLIQWVELYNSSMDETIDLKGWRLEFFNALDDVESYTDSGFTFNDAYILPNQTLLIVSGTGTNDVAANRVYNLYQHHRRELGLTNRRSVLLSPKAFYIKLTDKNEEEIDEAGNLEVNPQRRSDREPQWELPTRNPEYRQSLVRQYGPRELYDGTPDVADDGTMMESWRQSDLTGAGISFYGHRDDVGTPGYRLGGPLPASLSKFRPVRNQETGHVDITWITESELNNAGFNILRSEAKNGEFKVINVKGIIAGHGTTSEKHVYTFTDTTAKPNVVYYYQIEDVSINGLRTTLTTTHLRGHVGASGKLTTRWGELKSSGK